MNSKSPTKLDRSQVIPKLSHILGNIKTVFGTYQIPFRIQGAIARYMAVCAMILHKLALHYAIVYQIFITKYDWYTRFTEWDNREDIFIQFLY
jgi:hypothetical protein